MPFPSKAEAHGTSKTCAFESPRMLARMDFRGFLLLIGHRPDYQLGDRQNIWLRLENGRCERI